MLHFEQGWQFVSWSAPTLSKKHCRCFIREGCRTLCELTLRAPAVGKKYLSLLDNKEHVNREILHLSMRRRIGLATYLLSKAEHQQALLIHP